MYFHSYVLFNHMKFDFTFFLISLIYFESFRWYWCWYILRISRFFTSWNRVSDKHVCNYEESEVSYLSINRSLIHVISVMSSRIVRPILRNIVSFWLNHFVLPIFIFLCSNHLWNFLLFELLFDTHCDSNYIAAVKQ